MFLKLPRGQNHRGSYGSQCKTLESVLNCGVQAQGLPNLLGGCWAVVRKSTVLLVVMGVRHKEGGYHLNPSTGLRLCMRQESSGLCASI